MISLRRPLLPSSPPLLPLLVLLFLLGIAAGRGAESRGPLSLLPRPTTAASMDGGTGWVAPPVGHLILLCGSTVWS